MKRLVAVCMVAGLVLATSTAAFATPVSVTWSGDVLYNNTVSSGITNSTTNPGATGLITWFQPYAFSTPAAPDLSPYPIGGTLTFDKQIASAKLTIVATGVNPGQTDNLSIQSPSIWESLGSLKQLPAGTWSGSTTTVFGWPTGTDYSLPLSGTTGIDWLVGTTGFNAKVTLVTFPTNQGDTVSSSQLNATTHYTYTYTYDVPTPDPTPDPTPVVPAPGAILLASMGAGLVSWLRARKAL